MKKPIVIVAVLLLVAGAAGTGWFFINQANAARPVVLDSDLATVRRGTLVATVNATGTIQPWQQTSLAFTSSGNAAEVAVKVGDRVNKGQTLARLETRELELQLAQAEANLAVAQARLDQTLRGPSAEALAAARQNVVSGQAAYDRLQHPDPSAIAAAQQNLISAQAAFDRLQHPDASAVAAAQQNLASAQAAYDKLLHPDPNDLLALKADIDKSKALLDQAQAAYDRIGGATNPSIALTPQSAQLQSATLDYQKALALYNSKTQPTNAQLQQALAAVRSAQDQLARLEPTNAQQEQALAAVRSAQDQLARLNPTDAQLQQALAGLASAQDQLARLGPQAADVAVAQGNLEAARAGRDLAAERLKSARITAPFDGTVGRIDLDLGAFVPAGKNVITFVDISQLQVTLNIDETDIPRVQEGLTVTLELDAFPSQGLTGKVVEVAPGATTVQGVVNYAVKVLLNPVTLPVRQGMTANANIEVARRENVLLVPNRAIRATGNKRVVNVFDGKGAREAQITSGLSNDQETEALSGVEEGQRVFVTAVPVNVPNFGPGGGR